MRHGCTENCFLWEGEGLVSEETHWPCFFVCRCPVRELCCTDPHISLSFSFFFHHFQFWKQAFVGPPLSPRRHGESGLVLASRLPWSNRGTGTWAQLTGMWLSAPLSSWHSVESRRPLIAPACWGLAVCQAPSWAFYISSFQPHLSRRKCSLSQIRGVNNIMWPKLQLVSGGVGPKVHTLYHCPRLLLHKYVLNGRIKKASICAVKEM